MAQYSRESIINNGISYGKDAGDIDRALRKFGHSGLTMSEFNQISPLKNIPRDIARNIGNLGAGIPTAIGSAAMSIANGTVLEDAGKLVTGLPNAVLSTYNTSIDELMKHGLSGAGWGALQGVKEHPVEAALDFASLGGGKLLSAGKSALAESKTLNKLAKANKATKFLKDALLPTKAQREFRDVLGFSGANAKVKTRPLDKLVFDLRRASKGKMNDLVQATKNVRYGTMEGSKLAKDLTKQIHNIVKEQAGTAIKMNLMDSGTHYKNTIAQHITDMGGPAQLHNNSLKIVEKGLKGKLTDAREKKLFDAAKFATDEGRTSYLSQVLKPTKGFGHAEPVAEGGYFNKERFAGKTTPEVQATVLPETFDYVSEQIRRGDVASQGLKHIIDNYAEKINPADIQRILEEGVEDGKVIVKQEDLDKIIKGAFGNKQLDKAIRNIDSTQSIMADLAKGIVPKNIYKIDTEYLKALSNSVKRLRSSKLNNFIKRALLTLPKWVLENRYSNWLNNFIDGVTFKHYAMAFKRAQDAPPWLDEMTSYASFTGEPLGGTMRTRYAFDSAKTKIANAYDKGDFTKILSGINEICSIPIAAPEAFLEKVDRLANFIKHTEDYAKKAGKPFEEVYNAAKTNQDLFREIYSNTNKALGDYVSRNYFLPNELYEAANFIYPFWRFPVESLKITGRQIAHRPLGFQGFVGIPGRAGARQWEEYKEEFGLDPDDFTGGALYKKPDGKFMPYQFLSPGGNQYTAIANLFGSLTGTDQGSMLGINPMLTSAYKWMLGKNNFGGPARLKGTVNIQGKLYDVDKNGRLLGEHKITGGEKATAMMSDILNTTVVPYRQIKSLIRPTAYTILGQDMGSPYANSINPLQMGDIYSLQKTTLPQKMGQIIGFPIEYTYPEFKMKPSQLKRLQKSVYRKRNRKL